ncbi:MAG: hypothetical protein HC875_04925 [Anaerolineales bacterium]|nr:hypothetical protein [Anaerolineales bacterium]
MDVEVISVAWHLFTSLGFYGLRLYINSTGCPVCKPAYIQTLVKYFEPFADKLPPDDKMRLQKNPLRILDSKEPLTQPLLENAPRITDHLCADCASHFDRLKPILRPLAGPIRWIIVLCAGSITTPKPCLKSKPTAWAVRIPFVAAAATTA